MTQEEAEREKKFAKPLNAALDIISGGKRKWEPEWLDPLLFTSGKYSEIYWFKCSDLSERFKGWICILSKGIEETALHVPQESCIPILSWEEIERILLKTPAEGGCWNFYEPFTFKPEIVQGTLTGRWRVRYMWRYEKAGICRTEHFEWGKSRQAAVRNAILERAKELK